MRRTRYLGNKLTERQKSHNKDLETPNIRTGAEIIDSD